MKHISRHNVKKIKNFAVILLSAGIEDRAKGQGPSPLFKVGGTYLLDHQISAIRAVFGKCDIIPVVGFDSRKVISKIETKIGVIENQLYEETNSPESLRLALNATTAEAVLIIHGNVIFNKELFQPHSFQKSFILYEDYTSEKVGITFDKYVENFSYGLNNTWANVAYLNDKTLNETRDVLNRLDAPCMLFEAFNKVISRGCRILPVENKKLILEINDYKGQESEILNFMQGRPKQVSWNSESSELSGDNDVSS